MVGCRSPGRQYLDTRPSAAVRLRHPPPPPTPDRKAGSWPSHRPGDRPIWLTPKPVGT